MRFLYSFLSWLIFLFCAPFFEGVMRRITARVQSRKGPPLFQPYYDILKLLGKENMNSTGHRIFNAAPMIAFASISAVVVLAPLGSRPGVLAFRADIITLIYLLTLGGVSVLLGALASRNTFAVIGASREMVTMIMVEPVLAMTLILGAVKAKSLMPGGAVFGPETAGFGISAALMLVVYLLALQAFAGRQPFDIPEAEVELLEGPYIEYSGPGYALFRCYIMMKRMFYAGLFIAAFVPVVQGLPYVLSLLAHLGGILIVFVLISLVGATNPRLRIDQAVKYYAVLILAALCAVGLAAKGF